VVGPAGERKRTVDDEKLLWRGFLSGGTLVHKWLAILFRIFAGRVECNKILRGDELFTRYVGHGLVSVLSSVNSGGGGGKTGCK